MSTPNPLPCGCTVTTTAGMLHVQHCPLHTHAEGMREALRAIEDLSHKAAKGGLKWPGKAESIRDHKDMHRIIRDEARAMLRAVEGREGK